AKAALGVSILPTPLLAAPTSGSSSTKAFCDNVIFLYMKGGMSHIDTFDPKTTDVKGMSSPIATKSADLKISNLLPKLAEQGKHLAVVRSMHVRTGAHAEASYAMHTGFSMRPGTSHPHMGSWAQYFQGKRKHDLPDSVIVAGGNPGPGFFSPDHSPFPIGDPAKGIRDLLPKIPKNRFDKRVKLARQFAESFEYYFPHEDVKAYSDFYDQTIRFFDGEAVDAFNLYMEPRAVRERYGDDPFGQGCLLARRLVQKGVRYVEVKFKKSWDVMHRGMGPVEDLAATLDGPFSELLKDLQSRGMLERTLVVLATEFGRGPKINQAGGRDHHPKAFSCVFAGGGVKGGQAIGKTDPKGQGATGETYQPKNLHATMAYALGLPLDKRIHGSGGRPFFVGGQAKPIPGLFG
ncbi:MAG: DUF1501 domain-containing protein, partial [Opitutales bacterium]